MTVNDGLPFDESAIADPPTDVLPLRAMPPVDAMSDQPTQALPRCSPAPAPADSTTEGNVEGDLFDGVAKE